jgi:hypothetical protein
MTARTCNGKNRQQQEQATAEQATAEQATAEQATATADPWRDDKQRNRQPQEKNREAFLS